MAKLTRVTGKVFGSAATATVRGIGQFGSAAAGSPNLTTDVATIQALPAYLNGWGSAVITSRNFPPIEEVTGVLKTISYQTCYNLQEGVAEYDINTEYTNTSIVKSTNNGIITFYASLQDNNIGNSLTDTDYWKPTVLNLDNKADVDLSNANDTAKILMSGMGMPSDTYIDLTLGADGSTYIAPANGWFTIQKYNDSTIGDGYIAMVNLSNGLATENRQIRYAGSGGMPIGRVYIPAKKGDSVNVYYDITGSVIAFRFIYAVGSESEAS